MGRKKHKPLKPYLQNYKINTVGDIIRSYRLKKGITQNKLASQMGLFCVDSHKPVKCNAVTRYETGIDLPSLPSIDKLSNLLDIDREALFNAILKERYVKFEQAYYEAYLYNLQNKSDKKIKRRYRFCTTGKIQYKFPEFSNLLLQKKKNKNLRFIDIKNKIEQERNHSYSLSLIRWVMDGIRPPSLKLLLDLAFIFEIEPFILYKVAVRERALCHIKQMKEEWEKYKEKILDTKYQCLYNR